MVALPLDKFVVDDVSHNAGNVDVSLIDQFPKGRNRWWRITRTPDGGHYGLLLRAKDVVSPFDEGVVLPRHMVVAFVLWLTFKGVW